MKFEAVESTPEMDAGTVRHNTGDAWVLEVDSDVVGAVMRGALKNGFVGMEV